MSTLKRIYRTKDGQADFHFRFSTRPFTSEVRVYIDQTPSYGSRATDGHSTHRYTDVYGAHYVCFDPAPTDLTTAYHVAKQWAEHTWRYIRTGDRF